MDNKLPTTSEQQSAQGTQPSAQGTQPSAQGTQPSAPAAVPAPQGTQPSAQGTQPSAQAAAPEPPSMPNSITIPAKVVISFPRKDEDFHLNNVTDMESYQVGDHPIVVPIIRSVPGTKFSGISVTIGENGKVMRNWFRNDRKGILLWDISRPIGQELGVYLLEVLQETGLEKVD